MWGYKYVKFSRGTAKQNPEMIIDAYIKKINNIEDYLKKFKTKKFKVRLRNYETVLNTLITKSKILYNSGQPFEEELELNSEDIIKYYKQLEKQNHMELLTLDLLNKVREELSKFKENYEKTYKGIF